MADAQARATSEPDQVSSLEFSDIGTALAICVTEVNEKQGTIQLPAANMPSEVATAFKVLPNFINVPCQKELSANSRYENLLMQTAPNGRDVTSALHALNHFVLFLQMIAGFVCEPTLT